MNPYFCSCCNINCGDASNYKKHNITEKHKNCVLYRTFYDTYFKRLQFLRLKDKNTIDIQNIQNKINDNNNNVLAIKHHHDPIEVVQFDNVKERINEIPIVIDLNNDKCYLCGKNFIGKYATIRQDIYLKKFNEHFGSCEGKSKYTHFFVDDVVQNYILVEYLNALQKSYTTLATKHDTLVNEHLVNANKCDEVQKKYDNLLRMYNASIITSGDITMRYIKIVGKYDNLKTKYNSVIKSHPI